MYLVILELNYEAEMFIIIQIKAIAIKITRANFVPTHVDEVRGSGAAVLF